MVFKELFRAWRRKGILSQTLDEFIEMLEAGHWMFQTALDTLDKEGGDPDRRQRVRERDIGINKAERDIRRRVVEHLAIDPGTDVNYCLILMSVVKDAERIGDYCKNILEIADYYPVYKEENAWVSELKDFQAEVEIMFRRIGRTFRDSDEEMGIQLVRKVRQILRECDDFILKVAKSTEFGVAQGVAYALLARYFKRVAAHIGNIASSAVMPLHKLDYFDEKYLDEEEVEKQLEKSRNHNKQREQERKKEKGS